MANKPISVALLEREIAASTSVPVNPLDGDARPEEASYSVEQILALAETDLNIFAGLAIPQTFQYLFPALHIAIWAILQQLIGKFNEFPKIALGIPRGRGKTTLIKLFILWCILFTKCRFILVICATEQLASNCVSDVIDMLEELNIKRVFGDWKVGLEKDTATLRKFTFRGRDIITAAMGVGGSIRGLNVKNERPDIMVFDDIQTKEAAESQIQSEAIERWMIGTAMKARSPHGCLYIFLANMYPTRYSLLRKLKDNSAWIKFISGAILADGTSIWPQLFPIKTIIEELDNDIAMGHPEIFFSEIMNDTETGINSRVDLGNLLEWQFQPHELPQGKFIIIDPAGDKKNSDDVAIGYFEVYDGIPWLRNVVEEKLSPGNTIRRALVLALRTNTKVIAVESTAYQHSLLYWFSEISTQLGITGIQFVDVYTGSYSKNSRISDTLKAVTQKEIGVHPECKSKVINQIVNWNSLKRDNVDNILDLLTYAPQVMEKYGYLTATVADLDLIEANSARVVKNNVCF